MISKRKETSLAPVIRLPSSASTFHSAPIVALTALPPHAPAHSWIPPALPPCHAAAPPRPSLPCQIHSTEPPPPMASAHHADEAPSRCATHGLLHRRTLRPPFQIRVASASSSPSASPEHRRPASTLMAVNQWTCKRRTRWRPHPRGLDLAPGGGDLTLDT